MDKTKHLKAVRGFISDAEKHKSMTLNALFMQLSLWGMLLFGLLYCIFNKGVVR